MKHCQQEEALGPACTPDSIHTWRCMEYILYICILFHAFGNVHLHTLLYYVLNLHCMYLQYTHATHAVCLYVT